MDNNYSSTIKSCNARPSNSNTEVISKLRRLKIQESLLINNLKGHVKYNDIKEDDENISLRSTKNPEYRKYVENIRNTYIDIRNLFHDIKNTIISEDQLKETDLEDLKKDVLDLDTKIKEFKHKITTELKTLQDGEIKLTFELDQFFNTVNDEVQSKVQIKPYCKIIPSPVKALISSPFKYPAIQEFQEFMANSSNCFGGWNEYDHNTFIKFLKKYGLKDREDIAYCGTTINIENNCTIPQDFINDVLKSIPGINYGEIVSHFLWYSKYLCLRNRQKEALNRWKLNKRLINISKSLRQDKYNNIKLRHTSNKNNNSKAIVAANSDFKKQLYTGIECDEDRLARLIKPTSQWQNRCIKDDLTEKTIYSLENINKLRIPNWRIGLLRVE